MQKQVDNKLVDLVLGLKQKDAAAQDVFFNSYLAVITAICKKILQDEMRADEVAVEVIGDFILKHVHNLQTPQAAFSYLKLTAIRKARKLKEKQIREIDLAEDFDPDPRSTAKTEETAWTAKITNRLDGCLKKLKPKSRKVLQLSYFKELNHKEIGNLTGDSGQYIGRLLNKSLAFLRRCMQQHNLTDVHRIIKEAQTMSAEALLENALLKRFTPQGDMPCKELELLALVADGLADNEQMQAHHLHLTDCKECIKDLEWLNRLRAEGIGTGKIHNTQTPAWAIWAAAAALIVTIMIPAISFWSTKDKTTKDYQMVVKGPQDDIKIAVQRGIRQFKAGKVDKLMSGDQLGFFYTAKNSGYLLLLDIQSDGEISVLYPSGKEQSAEVAAGSDLALPDGGVFEAAKGCSWLVGLFSDQPLSLDDVQKPIIDAINRQKNCVLQLKINDVRTVWVKPASW